LQSVRFAWLAAALAVLGVAVSGPAVAASCRTEAGPAKADQYVRACLAITSATHPPCNAENSCATIAAHIRSMCAQDPTAPGWCKAYQTAALPDPPPPMPVPRPGFDCAKASSPVEREICAPGHDSLAEDDRQMAQLYAQALAAARDPAALRATQRDFLAERQHCAAPEPGQASEGLPLVHCIAELTHERIDALKALRPGHPAAAWSADQPPDPCGVWFGDDGWDHVTVLLRTGQVSYEWADLRTIVLHPTDSVGFDVDGTVWPARIDTDPDGQAFAVSADPHLFGALDQGSMLRVRRNGKVILRAPLTDYPAALAQERHLCKAEAR
jgi:uncharacterized protein YecT (DUF1311 family)